MTFDEVLAQAVELLQRERRVSYRALKRRFNLDDAYLEDLKVEIIQAKRLAMDEEGTVLVWTGDTAPAPAREQEWAPLAYTPPHLAEKIRTARTTLEGERKHVTVPFADLKGSMELLAERDPEEARQLLDPVLEHMMAAVHRYEGTVNQVLGDGIMALFGAPLALAALQHLPDSRATTEQAIDLRLGLRAALNTLGETPERILDHLRRAETLAETLGDQPRLGRVYADMGVTFRGAGEVERAIVYGQRALALAATLGHVGLQARTHQSLGRTYYDAGDYARAVENFGWNVATLQGDLLYERFGTNGSVAASSRAGLSVCHAERGAFTAGLAMAAEGLRIAETVNHSFTLMEACSGLSVVYQRQGDVQRAIPMLERAMGLCQDWHIPFLLPRQTATLGLAYALDGHVAAGLALVEQGVEQAVAMATQSFLAPVVACLSEAYLLAGRLEEARQRAAQAVELARQYQQRGNQAWALWLLGESTARQASPAVEPAAGHYRQALALAEALGMRPLQAHCHRGLGTLYAKLGQCQQARPELGAALDLYRAMAMTFWLPETEAALAQTG